MWGPHMRYCTKFQYWVLLWQGKRVSYYAVYDGHGGVDAVQYTLQHLHLNISNSDQFTNDTEKAMHEGFEATDKNFVVKSNREVSANPLTWVNTISQCYVLKRHWRRKFSDK